MAAEHEAAGSILVEPVGEFGRAAAEPKRRASIWSRPASGAALRAADAPAAPAGLSMTSIMPSRWSTRAWISSAVKHETSRDGLGTSRDGPGTSIGLL